MNFRYRPEAVPQRNRSKQSLKIQDVFDLQSGGHGLGTQVRRRAGEFQAGHSERERYCFGADCEDFDVAGAARARGAFFSSLGSVVPVYLQRPLQVSYCERQSCAHE